MPLTLVYTDSNNYARTEHPLTVSAYLNRVEELEAAGYTVLSD